MKIKGFSGIILFLVLNVMIAGCQTGQTVSPGPYLPTLIYPTATFAPSETYVAETGSTSVPQTFANTVIVDNTTVPQTENVSFFQPFQEVLQAIIPQATQVMEVAPTQVLSNELVNTIESFPTTAPTPSATPTQSYVYPDGVVPLTINPDGSVVNILPTPLTNHEEKPPCDMNPITYGLANGMDKLYDLAETRDGKICMYVAAPFCAVDMQMPYADWRMSQLAAAELPDEGNDKDIVMYGYNVIHIASLLGTTIDIDPNARIYILEDDLWSLKFTLLSNMCSDPDGRPVLKSIGINQMLDFLKSKVQ